MMQPSDDLNSRIQTHPGKRILDGIEAYTFSKDIFAGNAIQLRLLALPLEDISDPLKVGGVEQRAKLQALFHEVIRLFHNFLASGKTLIDHTRNLMNEEFVTDQHRSEYKAEVNRIFVDNQIARFTQDFRNYVLHRAIPHIALNYTLEPERIALNLQLIPMSEWENWSPPARAFIEAHKPAVRILELVDRYEAMVKSFHETFVLSFQVHYEASINEALLMMQQWNRRIQK
jgi:hypothetical protein